MLACCHCEHVSHVSILLIKLPQRNCSHGYSFILVYLFYYHYLVQCLYYKFLYVFKIFIVKSYFCHNKSLNMIIRLHFEDTPKLSHTIGLIANTFSPLRVFEWSGTIWQLFWIHRLREHKHTHTVGIMRESDVPAGRRSLGQIWQTIWEENVATALRLWMTIACLLKTRLIAGGQNAAS